jgi:hypothetical protein
VNLCVPAILICSRPYHLVIDVAIISMIVSLFEQSLNEKSSAMDRPPETTIQGLGQSDVSLFPCFLYGPGVVGELSATVKSETCGQHLIFACQE